MYNKQRIFQRPVIGRNMELAVKIVSDFKQYTIFAKGSILDVWQVLSSPLTTFFTFFYVFYKQRKNYITVFCNGDSYYPARILPVQS